MEVKMKCFVVDNAYFGESFNASTAKVKKVFLFNSIILLLTNFVVRPLYLFGVEMKIQNTVGAEEYGLYFLVFDFVFLFIAINDPGLQAYSSRILSAERSQLKNIFRGILGAKIILSLLFIMVAVLGGLFFGYDERKLKLILLVSSGLVLSSTFLLFRSAIAGAGNYTVDSWISALDRLLMIIILGGLVWFPLSGFNISIESMVIVQLICYIIANLVCLAILFKHRLIALPKIEWLSLKKILLSTLPFAGVILFTTICNRIDVVMLNELLPKQEALFQSGIYAAGYRFLDAANMMGYLFGALLVPIYANELSNGRSINELFNLAFRILLVLSIIVGIAAISYSKEIFELCYTVQYSKHSNIMSPLMLSLVPITLTNVFGSLILATGKLRYLNYVLLIGIAINVTLNFFVIPKFGAVGSAYTTFVTELFLIGGSYYLVKLLSSATLDKQTLWKSVLFIFCTLALGVAFLYLPFHWLSEMVLLMFISLGIAIGIKLFDVAELKSVFIKEKL